MFALVAGLIGLIVGFAAGVGFVALVISRKLGGWP